MNKKLFPIVKDTLLVTLLIYTLIVSWNYGGLLAFVSIVLLGIVLGLLTLVYDIPSLSTSKQIGIHIGGSVLAILIVALINGWLVIDWGRVFTIILVIAILGILAFGAYMYFKNKKENPQQNARPSDFDNTLEEEYEKVSDEIAYVDEDKKINPDVVEEDHEDNEYKETPRAFSDYPGDDKEEPMHYHPEDDPRNKDKQEKTYGGVAPSENYDYDRDRDQQDSDYYHSELGQEFGHDYVEDDRDSLDKETPSAFDDYPGQENVEPEHYHDHVEDDQVVVDDDLDHNQDVNYIPTHTDSDTRPDEALLNQNQPESQDPNHEKSTYSYPEDL